MMTFIHTTDFVACRWPSGQEHRLPHADFLRLVGLALAGPDTSPRLVTAAAACPPWQAFLVTRWLVSAGALRRVGKSAYRPVANARRLATLSYLGVEEDDDVPDRLEDELVPAA